MKKIRVGIVGAGSISELHLKGYNKLDNVEIVAVCDINEERAKEYSEKNGISGVYTDYNEMIKNSDLDAIDITAWNNAHCGAAIAGLHAGLNVLCEKPMALNADEALAMEKAAKESGKLLMIGFVRRFGTNTEIAKTFIDNNDLGDIYYIKTKCIRRVGNPCGWFSNKELSGGGPLIDLGVHMIDLARYLMGKPKAISVYGATFNNIGPRNNIKNFARYYPKDKNEFSNVEDFATAMVRFDNGAILNVEVSFSAHIKEDEISLDIFGSKSGMKFEPSLEIYTEKYDRLVDVTPVITEDADAFSANFENEIAHFVDCIENKKESINPPEDGVELMKILDAIYKSAELKKEILL
ncbi:MAG: Gfo/Idh/MocA family oxidoreductase [Oscillospiraceae bacterium]